MNFTHILMTRFNLATPGRELAIRTQPGWLEGRFELFERYCLPAVAGQDNRDFQWIIYFDKDTPDAFKARIDTLRGIFPFVPYYTGLFPAEGWRNSINETFAPSTDYVLTTRLDNDDALAPDFTARLHEAVQTHGMAEGSYNFPNGMILRDGAVYAISHDSNPFFSFLEPAGPALCTAPNIHHMKIAEKGPVMQINAPPVWMQIVHETNVSNRVRGRRVVPDTAQARFSTMPPEAFAPASSGALLLDNLVMAPARDLRDRVAGLLRGGHKAR